MEQKVQHKTQSQIHVNTNNPITINGWIIPLNYSVNYGHEPDAPSGSACHDTFALGTHI